MSTKDIMKLSIQNVREVINNSILLLRDVDNMLSREGLIPLFGSTLGTETSKNIGQSMDQNSYNTFFPQFMCRVYVDNNELQQNRIEKVTIVNVQLYHANCPLLYPTVIAGIFKLPRTFTAQEIKQKVNYWWLKHVAFEYCSYEKLKFDGTSITVRPWVEEKNETEVVFWCHELHTFENQGDIERKIVEQIREYKNFPTYTNEGC
ncbi:hypothetical protein [Bacillus cereus]|uniref:hypothetical protein n=1 Tax=Bacillus cereus TaxID=1396 RepID=UPI00027A9864|nr:hypothetical protein [Bacillus cereus]EJS65180.1 hypothetical protein ICU_04052 [Bacillus cereus BAG2X1-1]EJS73742.1 hypothetical protein ICY_03907 [Bacillus cereus BAG2X1-3]PEA08606.1 hypothetical protein CON38_15970 [Bacillus cereus]PFI18522.1 hypothetical protein COI75_18390 [Bacillus cereus]